MSDPGALSARIDVLEVRLTYQDEIIEDLNGTILAQWKQIDSLTRQLRQIRDFVETKANPDAILLPEKPPPHY